MYKKLMKRIRFLWYLQHKHPTTAPSQSTIDTMPPPTQLSQNLTDTIALCRQQIGSSSDVIFREFLLATREPRRACLCFIDGLCDKSTINTHIVKALMVDARNAENTHTVAPNLIILAKDTLLSTSEVKEQTSFTAVITDILAGEAALFIDGYQTALIVGTKGWEARSVTEPQTAAVIRGPREGFVESLRTNTSLLRRKIKNPDFVLEAVTLGQQTSTDVCLAYIRGIANEKIVTETKRRLQRIDTDAILESGYLEQFIEDNPYSLFSTIGSSEKPDIIAAKLLEGRVAILCDGTPFVLTIPCFFNEAFQSAEDYYARPFYASMVRLLRFLSFFITLTSPALYVALETFHQEMIPTILLVTAAAAREGIPFPAFIEAIIIGIIFEVLRESGVRMPRPVGQAVSIVGALVIGQATVQAGIISAPMVIIAALTGITSFIIPPLVDVIVPFRLILLMLSAAFGLYGIAAGMIILLGHLCSLRSFGTPYLAPFAPTMHHELHDSLVRLPLWFETLRSQSITWRKQTKQSPDLNPAPPPDKDGHAS